MRYDDEEVRAALANTLAAIVPPGLKVAAAGDWTAADTEERLGGVHVPLDGHDEVSPAAIVHIDGPGAEGMAAIMDAAGTLGLPLGCLMFPADFGKGRNWSIDEFEHQAEQRDLRVRVRFLRPDLSAAVFFLTPAGNDDGWWRTPEAEKVLARLWARSVKQMQKFEQGGADANWKFVSRSWNERADLAATMIPQGTRMMDVGCGAMYLEVATKPAFYMPVDIEARDERTRVLDLNGAPIPAEWLDEVDHVAFMGVFEYLDDPLGVVARCARHGKTMICSYNHAEARKPQLTAKRFANNLTLDEVEAMFAQAGYAIARREPFHTNQFVWLLVPAAGAAGGEG